MRTAARALALSAALVVLTAAGTAGAAWRFEENGPHPRTAARHRSESDVRPKGPSAKGPIYSSTCTKWRRSTTKPFKKYCVRREQSPSR